MSDEFALVDFRKKDAIDVTKLDTKLFSVVLKFYLKLTEPDPAVDTDALLKEWCSKWTSKVVSRDFEYSTYSVEDHCWLSPGVLELVIETDRDMTERDVKKEFLDESLEDGVYEGDTFNSFWIIPVTKTDL